MAVCFVIGPIGMDGSAERKHADLLLHAVIKEVLNGPEFDYAVKRADEDADPGMIGDRIVSDIINSELVVADLTDLNPNVFYELGIRHSTEKPTIHLAKVGTLLPFDNITHRTIFVDLGDWDSIRQSRDRLAASVRAIQAPNYKVSNPITQANASFKMRQSDDPRDVVVSEMQERIVALETLVRNLDEPPGAGSAEQISTYLRRNMKVNAIKVYKEATSASLSTAKDFIEAVQSGHLERAVAVHQQITGISSQEAWRFVESL
jgi:hypothetical protein